MFRINVTVRVRFMVMSSVRSRVRRWHKVQASSIISVKVCYTGLSMVLSG